jgi:hypothetical protein
MIAQVDVVSTIVVAISRVGMLLAQAQDSTKQTAAVEAKEAELEQAALFTRIGSRWGRRRQGRCTSRRLTCYWCRGRGRTRNYHGRHHSRHGSHNSGGGLDNRCLGGSLDGSTTAATNLIATAHCTRDGIEDFQRRQGLVQCKTLAKVNDGSTGHIGAIDAIAICSARSVAIKLSTRAGYIVVQETARAAKLGYDAQVIGNVATVRKGVGKSQANNGNGNGKCANGVDKGAVPTGIPSRDSVSARCVGTAISARCNSLFRSVDSTSRHTRCA